jgi:hypothetical protein
LLRYLIERTFGIPGAWAPIELSATGKPRLVGVRDFAFNLSHSGDWVVLATSEGGSVGIDIEPSQAPRNLAVERISARYFHPPEQRALAALDPSQRRTGFARLWTLKEAYLKATGRGLSGLDAAPAFCLDSPRLLAPGAAPAGWSFGQVTASALPGYVIALAAPGNGEALTPAAATLVRLPGFDCRPLPLTMLPSAPSAGSPAQSPEQFWVG